MWWITTTPPRGPPSSGRARYASISSPPCPAIVTVSALIASLIPKVASRVDRQPASHYARATPFAGGGPPSPASLGSGALPTQGKCRERPALVHRGRGRAVRTHRAGDDPGPRRRPAPGTYGAGVRRTRHRHRGDTAGGPWPGRRHRTAAAPHRHLRPVLADDRRAPGVVVVGRVPL